MQASTESNMYINRNTLDAGVGRDLDITFSPHLVPHKMVCSELLGIVNSFLFRQ